MKVLENFTNEMVKNGVNLKILLKKIDSKSFMTIFFNYEVKIFEKFWTKIFKEIASKTIKQFDN